MPGFRHAAAAAIGRVRTRGFTHYHRRGSPLNNRGDKVAGKR
jgi:hypothetical protein